MVAFSEFTFLVNNYERKDFDGVRRMPAQITPVFTSLNQDRAANVTDSKGKTDSRFPVSPDVLRNLSRIM